MTQLILASKSIHCCMCSAWLSMSDVIDITELEIQPFNFPKYADAIGAAQFPVPQAHPQGAPDKALSQACHHLTETGLLAGVTMECHCRT